MLDQSTDQKTGRFHLPPLRPEAEILLCSTGIWEETSRLSRIRSLLEQELDWDYLLRAAAHNRVSTLLYWNLAKADSERVPKSIMVSLRNEYDATFNHNLLMVQELTRILKQFETAAIPILPYRGPLMAFSLYGNPALRQIWDLDLLVHPEDVLRAKEILMANGYRPKDHLNESEEKILLKQNDEYIFIHDKLWVEIEVHWRLLPPYLGPLSDPEFIWQHATENTLAGTKLWTLSPEILLLVVLIHAGVKHHWTELKWISDTARMIDADTKLDWDEISGSGFQTQDEIWIWMGLHLARILLGADLPEVMLNRIRKHPKIHTYFGLVIARLFRDNFGLPGYAEWLRYTKFCEEYPERKLTRMHQLRYYFRYLRAVMTPEVQDRTTVPTIAGEKISLFHYVIRFIRLFSKHGLNLFRRIR